jgi:hypothetical protein
MNNYYREKRYKDPRILGLIIGISATFAPFGFAMARFAENMQFIVAAMTWTWISILPNSAGPVLRLTDYYEFSSFFLFTFLRYIFAIQIIRYYRNKIDRRSVTIWAILSETPTLALLILLSMIDFSSGGYFGEFQITIPVPIVLVIGLIMVYIIPPTPISIWDSSQEN